MRSYVLALACGLLLVTLLVLGYAALTPTATANQTRMSRVEAIDRVKMVLGHQAAIVDIRLLRHEEAHAALGVHINYYRLDYPYRPWSPVWVITAAAEDAETHLPMFGEGYAGAIFVVNATDGEIGAMRSFSDLATDSTFATLRSLPGRGQ